jgi:hypothetical protein
MKIQMGATMILHSMHFDKSCGTGSLVSSSTHKICQCNSDLLLPLPNTSPLPHLQRIYYLPLYYHSVLHPGDDKQVLSFLSIYFPTNLFINT